MLCVVCTLYQHSTLTEITFSVVLLLNSVCTQLSMCDWIEVAGFHPHIKGRHNKKVLVLKVLIIYVLVK